MQMHNTSGTHLPTRTSPIQASMPVHVQAWALLQLLQAGLQSHGPSAGGAALKTTFSWRAAPYSSRLREGFRMTVSGVTMGASSGLMT